jgi:23S rRNA (cytidine1920-2'-O)/16S rRNA (cytidine1409-2'-O)-methyltransferase
MKRLDIYLVENGLIQSRERAKENIQKGLVSVNGKPIVKPSFLVDEGSIVEFKSEEAMQFVGRGGLKLEKAIKDFELDFKGKYVLDVGASTGGFTHCALQQGAAFVWAIDVGTNQLDVSLRNHVHVCSMEECDIRKLPEEEIPRKVDFVVADLSFISLTIVAPYLPKFLLANGAMMLLIKPQFEAGKEFVNKNGIVRDSKAHIMVIEKVVSAFNTLDFHLNNISNAPIYSKDKNIEYLALFSKSKTTFPDIKQLVNFAFDLQKNLK